MHNFKYCLRHHEEETASPLPCGSFGLRSSKEKLALGSFFPDKFSFSMLHLWSLLDLLHMTYHYLNHTLRPHHRRLILVVNLFLALRARKVLLDSLLDHLRHSDPLPLPDTNLAGRIVLASRRSLPEPLRSEGVFGSRSLVPLWRSAAA